jgi:hypothetical protein
MEIPIDEHTPEQMQAPAAELTSSESAQLFEAKEAQNFRTRWERIQGSFVDEPRKSVQDADALVGETVNRLTEVFSEERSKLEHEWDKGDSVSTEELRLALRRYRSFFDRLLTL